MAIFLEDNAVSPVTALLSSSGDQLFENLGILELEAASSKAYAQHTLENGVTIADHVVRLQDRVSLRCIFSPAEFTEIYRRIKRLYEANTSFIIQTKVAIYSNMYIESLPHREDNRDTIAINLEFVEQQFQSSRVTTLTTGNTSNPSDSDTQQTGNKQPSNVPEEQKTTVLNDAFGDLL